MIEGGTEADTLIFNGSAGAEIPAASANGPRLSFTRNLGNIVMDIDDVETIAWIFGGSDSVAVNSLGGTDVTAVNVDLGVSGVGDGAADVVTVVGTPVSDVIQISAVGTTVQINGLVRSGEHLKFGSSQRLRYRQRLRRERCHSPAVSAWRRSSG